MIKEINISNFKSIEEMNFECSPLNLLIGTNSSGKSTILQALLFACQNIETSVGLNGALVNLGEFEENKCWYSGKKEISINITDEIENKTTMILARQQREDGTSPLLMIATENDFIKKMLDIRKRKIQYLSCHRIGPQNLYRKNMALDEVIGNDGEYAVSYLNNHGAEPLEKELCKGGNDYTLQGQVNWWLNYIVNAEIDTEEIPGADAIKASYRMGDISKIRPGNIGSGISYLISVLIMCLSAPEHAILVIENPEIHLHPAAQSKVCEFLYFISKHNRQVFVESHSDHIFNGFRAGIANGQMDSKAVNIQFAYLNEKHVTEITKVKIGRLGRIENQQENMFDQFDIDLNRMIGL